MLVTMSDLKNTEPTTVVSPQQDGSATKTSTKPGKLTKKHVLIAMVCVVIVGLLVTAVLVGIRLVSDSNKEILQMSLSLKSPGANDSRQTISTDAYANIVIYQVKQNGLDITVNDDFDKDIQLIKIDSGSSVDCFVTPLNRSNALDLKSLPLPSDYNPSIMMNITAARTVHLSYESAPTPINDTTFLGKRANAVCINIPIYWLRPTCTESVVESSTAVAVFGNHTRSKRGINFGCSCSWDTCESCVKVRVLGRTISKCVNIPCNYHCQCCSTKCQLVALTSACLVCWLATPVWEACAAVCIVVAAAVGAIVG